MNSPSVKLVAEKCGISPSTVCRALNGKGDINPKTRRLVLDVCAEVGYVQNAAAGRLRGQTSRLLACVMHEGENELLIEKIHHLKELARGAGYDWRLSHFRSSDERLAVAKSYVAGGVAGMIFDGCLDSRSEHLLVCNNVPVVVYDGESSVFDSVRLDRGSGVFSAVKHLFNLGRNRIVLLGVKKNGPRYAAYAKAHVENAAPLDSELIISDDFGRNLYEYGYGKTLDLIRSETKFDAVLAVNDACAIGAMRAFNESGLKVPEDIAVIGFDDIMVAPFVSPTLSTVAQPVANMARSTIELLLDRLDNPVAPPRKRTHKTKLALRESA